MQVKTRAQAKRDGDKYYFTGKPCKHKHVSIRYTGKGTCVECHDAYKKTEKHLSSERKRRAPKSQREIQLYIIRNPGLSVAVIARRVNRKMSAVYDAFRLLGIPRGSRPGDCVG